MNDEDVRQSNLDKVLKQNAYLLTYVLRGSVQRSTSMMEEEVPAGEPAKQEMEIEKPRAKVAAQNGKLNGKLEAMAEKQEKNVPRTPAPVPVDEKKFIQLHNPNEEAKEQKQPVKSQVKPGKTTEKMQVEKDSTKIENKTQNNKESKMEIEKKEVAKQIKKTPTEIVVKKQEELPEPELEKQKSLSEKVFENLIQPIVKTNPTPVLNGLLDDSLDAPSNKRRMEVLPPSLAKSVSKDSLIKDKAEKVVNLIRKPSLQKLEKKDSIVKEDTKQEEEKPVKGSVKIETPQIKDYEKMSYSKQLEALLDDREAKVYMVSKSSNKRVEISIG